MSEPQILPPVEDKQPTPLTTYAILSQGVDDAWFAEGEFAAHGNRAAVAGYVKAKKIEEGTFVAVPARSWQPITVRVETTPRLVFD